jgi:hypothetical protein
MEELYEGPTFHIGTKGEKKQKKKKKKTSSALTSSFGSVI